MACCVASTVMIGGPGVRKKERVEQRIKKKKKVKRYFKTLTNAKLTISVPLIQHIQTLQTTLYTHHLQLG